MPDVHNAQITGMSKMPRTTLSEDHWSRSFIPTELTQHVAI